MNFLRMLESVRNPYLTVFFRFCTFFGDEIFMLALICCLYWCINKNLAYRIGLAFLISGLLVQELKIIFRVERPWITDPSFRAVEEAITTATGYSFPSGHTQSSTALFGSFALYVHDRRIKLISIAAFLLVGVSRMYLGVHTPADVIFSILLTLTVIVFVFFYMKRFDGTPAGNKATAVAIIILSAAVLIHAIILQEKNLIEHPYVSDLCKAAAVGFGFALGWFIERTYICFDERKGCFWQQILKLICGLSVIIFIKAGLKLLLGDEIWADIIRYFILSAWALVLYPFILQKLMSKNR